jgi:TRAP-type C4-dicarboxylate transport system permease small subunit
MTLVDRVKQGLEKAINWISIAAFVAIFFVSLTQIILRSIFKTSIIWSEEFVRLVYVWICYLGWTMATKAKAHICITALSSRLSPVAQKALESVNCLLVIAFSVFMVWYGIGMTEVGGRGTAVTLPINFAVVYISVPISNTIILFYQILAFIAIWKKPESPGTVLAEGSAEGAVS